MDAMRDLAKILIIVGAALVAVGLAMLGIQKLPFLGKLPGDILIKRENFTFYFPLAYGNYHKHFYQSYFVSRRQVQVGSCLSKWYGPFYFLGQIFSVSFFQEMPGEKLPMQDTINNNMKTASSVFLLFSGKFCIVGAG